LDRARLPSVLMQFAVLMQRHLQLPGYAWILKAEWMIRNAP
jgi:hypothetical protein